MPVTDAVAGELGAGAVGAGAELGAGAPGAGAVNAAGADATGCAVMVEPPHEEHFDNVAVFTTGAVETVGGGTAGAGAVGAGATGSDCNTFGAGATGAMAGCEIAVTGFVTAPVGGGVGTVPGIKGITPGPNVRAPPTLGTPPLSRMEVV